MTIFNIERRGEEKKPTELKLSEAYMENQKRGMSWKTKK